MSNSLNSYLLLLKHCSTKKVWVNTVKNLSDNDFYYEFDFVMPEDCPSGEYNYYLVWDTYDTGVELTIKDEILDSTFRFLNGNKITLRDTMPETGIIKYIKENQSIEELEYNEKTDYLVYEG